MTETQSASPIEIDPNQEHIVLAKSGEFLKSIRGVLSRLIVNFALITTVLTVLGFFIVHSYLDKFTNISTYHIDIPVYTAAGVNVVITITIGIILWLREPIIFGVATGIILIFLALVAGFIIKSSQQVRKFAQAVSPILEKYVFPILRLLLKLNNGLLFILLAIVAIKSGIDYGKNYYEHSPHYLGGGAPSDVILVFSQPDKLETMGLPIQINPTYSAQSQPVELLMELSDGVLVRDLQTQIPVIIKNDLLYGMIDAAPPTPAATTTP